MPLLVNLNHFLTINSEKSQHLGTRKHPTYLRKNLISAYGFEMSKPFMYKIVLFHVLSICSVSHYMPAFQYYFSWYFIHELIKYYWFLVLRMPDYIWKKHPKWENRFIVQGILSFHKPNNLQLNLKLK